MRREQAASAPPAAGCTSCHGDDASAAPPSALGGLLSARAIGAHRAKRSADIKKNPLDEIGGIGPARKKALLQYFGSAKGVAQAKLADLKEVDGVSAALAERIYGHFNSG